MALWAAERMRDELSSRGCGFIPELIPKPLKPAFVNHLVELLSVGAESKSPRVFWLHMEPLRFAGFAGFRFHQVFPWPVNQRWVPGHFRRRESRPLLSIVARSGSVLFTLVR